MVEKKDLAGIIDQYVWPGLQKHNFSKQKLL